MAVPQSITVLSTVLAQEGKIRGVQYVGDGRNGSVGGLETLWKDENEFGQRKYVGIF